MCLEFPDLLLPLKGLWRGSPHGTFHPDNQASGDPGMIYLEGLYSSEGPAVVSLGPGRLDGPERHSNETRVKVRKGK